MRKVKLLILLVLLSITILFSQKKYIGFEIAGSNGLVGISFDSRFNYESKLGYKMALSYGFEKNDGVNHWYFSPVKAYFPENGQLCNFVSIPINLHYLVGKEKHFLETAMGINIFATDYNFGQSNQIGYFSFTRIAYRYESNTVPLLLSIGFDMPFKTSGSGLGYLFSIAPSISIGYKL